MPWLIGFSFFCFFASETTAGNNKPPNAIIVIPDAPVKAVKPTETIMTINAIPPGKWPSKERVNSRNLRGALLDANIRPAKVKSGRAVSVGTDPNLLNSTAAIPKSVPD